MKAKRKLHYLGAPHMFMHNLLNQGKNETAWAVKSHLLEICNFGPEMPGLQKKGDTPNVYSSHAQAAASDGAGHPGFEIEVLVMAERVAVIEIKVAEVSAS